MHNVSSKNSRKEKKKKTLTSKLADLEACGLPTKRHRCFIPGLGADVACQHLAYSACRYMAQ